MRMFFAIATAQGYLVTFADVVNAYQQSPPPTDDCYLEIDEAYRSWYRKRFDRDIDPKKHVIPIHHALQGHPEAGVSWETMIVGVLDELGFKSATRERNLHQGKIDGQDALICRQVDDLAPLPAQLLQQGAPG